MGVEKGPNELPADIFQAEFEMRVLIDSVVAAEKCAGADVQTLLVCNFLGTDQTRRIASARSGDCRVKRVCESVAETDARRSTLDKLRGVSAFKHARLSGHVRLILHARGTEAKRERPGSAGGDKQSRRIPRSAAVLESYFLAPDLAAASAYFFVKRSTRPAVSISFCLPVKNGWQLEQISTFSLSPRSEEHTSELQSLRHLVCRLLLEK